MSRDLIRWHELPVALPETDVVTYSGSAVIDRANSSGFGCPGVPAMVPVHKGHNPRTGAEAQHLAASTDRGRTFACRGRVLDTARPSFAIPSCSGTHQAGAG